MSDHIEPQLSLGSKLTIISKAGIRYEGTLYLIDTIKESIALQNVRFYGTEDRKVAKQHPPKSEIFECIVFKASDLQDLTLVPEEQDPPADSLCFHDPAVISSKPAAPSSFENDTVKQESLIFVNRQLSSNDDSVHKNSPSSSSLAYPTSDMNSSKPKHGGYQGYEMSRGQGTPYRNHGPDWGRPRNSAPPPPQPAPTARGSGTVSFTQDFDFEEANSRFKKDEFAEEFRKKLKIRNSLTVSQAEEDTPAPDITHSPTVPKRPTGETTGPSSAETTPTPAKPNGTATAEGRKEREPGELRSEDESEDSGVDIAYYDKTKSFFDQISTDNPVNKRGKFREERSLNSQTFGVSSPPPGTGPRRGPRRGMRRGSDYVQYRNPDGPGGYHGEYRNTPRYEYEYDYEYYPPHPQQRNRGYAPRGYRRSTAPPPHGYYQNYPPPEHEYYDMPPPPHEYYRPPPQHRSDRGPPNTRREENYNNSYVQSKTFRNSRIATGSSGSKPRDRNN